MATKEETRRGRFTLPVDVGMDEELKALAERWGADVVRNSDGTELPPNIEDMGLEVYSTLSLTRVDQQWAKAHRDQLTQKYLVSDPCTATSDTLEIDLLEGYFDEQFAIDTIHDPKEWFEVNDRTTSEVVAPSSWEFDPESGVLTIHDASKFHVYTVTFLVYQIWDTTSMYNYVTNEWTGEHVMPLDPCQPETRRHLIAFLQDWLERNPQTDVVRLTSLAYHFTNNFQRVGDGVRSRYRDWLGYHDCTSVLALEEFAEAKGYALRPEDIGDQGYMNDVNRVPSSQYLDWMDFIQKSVADITKEWVEVIHDAGRKAMMFFCDHWIGAEPYGEHFPGIGLDAIVNPCMTGIELRRIADIPVDMTVEVRLYPYFFPLNLEGKPSFSPGGDPTGECRRYWMNIRRAMVRKLADRIGFGGYPGLAVKFPDFIEYVAHLADEFRSLHEHTRQTEPYAAPFKVGVLNCWGKLRSWIDAEINNWTKPYRGGVLEALAGMGVDVVFLSFDDILENGVPEDVGLLINQGDVNTSWSGGYHWGNEKLVTAIRAWVYERGGGFIGVGEPTAYTLQGRVFQLFDVLGVDRELGWSISTARPALPTKEKHFILEDQPGPVDLGEKKDRVYAIGGATEVLLQEGENIYLATNTYGKGRGVYVAGYVFSPENTRLLLRALYWAAGREEELKKWFTTNPRTDCAAFPETGKFVVLNNSGEPQETTIYDAEGRTKEVALAPYASRWFESGEMAE